LAGKGKHHADNQQQGNWQMPDAGCRIPDEEVFKHG
jgi:hypothetical protein